MKLKLLIRMAERARRPWGVCGAFMDCSSKMGLTLRRAYQRGTSPHDPEGVRAGAAAFGHHIAIDKTTDRHGSPLSVDTALDEHRDIKRKFARQPIVAGAAAGAGRKRTKRATRCGSGTALNRLFFLTLASLIALASCSTAEH